MAMMLMLIRNFESAKRIPRREDKRSRDDILDNEVMSRLGFFSTISTGGLHRERFGVIKNSFHISFCIRKFIDEGMMEDSPSLTAKQSTSKMHMSGLYIRSLTLARPLNNTLSSTYGSDGTFTIISTSPFVKTSRTANQMNFR
jgi:hypothetical protein